MADCKGEACEANNEIKHHASHVRGDGVGNMKSEISATRVSGELEFELFSADSKHETDMQSSDGIVSTQPTPVKSDISTEIGLPLSSGSFEMDGRKTHKLNATEDGVNARCQDPQQRTESSCSNSLSTILPVHCYQETSKETCSFRNCVVSADSSNTKGFDFRLEEPVTASFESGACHEHDNLNAAHSVGRMMHMEISGENKGTLAVKAKLLEMGPEVIDKIKADSWANEPSESSMTKPGNVAIENQDTCVAGFDLNEDIKANGINDCVQPPAAMESSQPVIQVVAKAGRPNGQPKVPLMFEGRLDWKGTTETSAFRPAGISRTSEKKSCPQNEPEEPQGLTGIDLNVAVAEDNSANGMPMEPEGISSASALQESHSESGLKQSKSRPLIDLNCLYDAADEFTQPSPPSEPGNPPLVDLSSSGNAPKGDKSNILHWPNKDDHALGNNTSDSANPRKHYFNFIGQDCFSNAHMPVAAPNILQPVEMFQRAASLQPKLAFGSPTLNLQSYPSNGPRHFISGGPLPSSVCFPGTVPYARYSHDQGIYPGFLSPGTVHPSFCTPHLVQIVHEPGSSSIAASFPNLDVRTEENLSTSRIKMDEARQFAYIATNPPTGERMHQGTRYDASMKRKQPEGGFGHYQLGYN